MSRRHAQMKLLVLLAMSTVTISAMNNNKNDLPAKFNFKTRKSRYKHPVMSSSSSEYSEEEASIPVMTWKILDKKFQDSFEQDENGHVLWKTNAKVVAKLEFGNTIEKKTNFKENQDTDFEAERLKFVNAVFSKIPNKESPTAYDFYFDRKTDNKHWFMLAIHKLKNRFIGAKWDYFAMNNYETNAWEPVEVNKQWIYGKSCTDRISKALLDKGFNFAPEEGSTDKKRKRENLIEKTKKSNEPYYPSLLNRAGRPRIFHEKVQNAALEKREQCEQNLECALDSKLEKSAMFVLSSFCDGARAAQGPQNTEGLVSFTENFLIKKNLESWPYYSADVKDSHIKKAFDGGLYESFTLMMKCKGWPENLWEHVLESENRQSKEMMRVLCERIKPCDLFKANDEKKMPFFEKSMHLVSSAQKNAKDRQETAHHFRHSLKSFDNDVRHQVYQYFLFFGVLKDDTALCDFALNAHVNCRAVTTEKIESKDCCSNAALNNKTALQIAEILNKKNTKTYLKSLGKQVNLGKRKASEPVEILD